MSVSSPPYQANARFSNLPCASSLTPCDNAGNQLCDTDGNGANRVYSYDGNGMITNVTMQNGGSPFASYQYLPNGSRVRKETSDGNWTEFVYFSGQPIAEKHPDTTWSDYIYANGQRIARADSPNSSSNTTYYHGDQIGSVRLLTSSNGSPVTSDTFYPFGLEPGGTAGPNRYQYAGLERDPETGLDHATFRQYSSTMGRWMSPDPYDGSMDLGNPQTLNRYSYVGNNPLLFTDPSGLQAGTNHGDPLPGQSCSGGCSFAADLITLGVEAAIRGIESLFYHPQFHASVKARPTFGNTVQNPDGTYSMSVSYTTAPLPDDIPLSPYAFQVISGVAQKTAAFPDVCSGGGFVYAGAQRGFGNYHGFAGYLGNYDSKLGGSNSFLLEGSGEHVGGAGALGSQGIEGLAFVPLAGEGGGLVGLSKEGFAIGAYLGTPEKFPIGVGGGGYFNVSSIGSCRHR